MGLLYKTMPGFLGEETRIRLLDYALANESRFEATGVGDDSGDRLDDRIRVSHRLTDLGSLQPIVEQKVLKCVPRLVAELGMTPFQPSGVEIEMVVHGDACFYRRHIDVFTGTGRIAEGNDRLLTVVYYFYQEPKSFKGGALRLYPLSGIQGAGDEAGVDVAVEQGNAVAFSSWIPHEVLETRCPSKKFADSRFSINCWVLRKR